MVSPRSILLGALLAATPSLISATTCSGTQAPSSDLAACANSLRARGDETVSVRGGGGVTTVCTSGQGAIVLVGNPSGSASETYSIPCVNVANSVGFILDACSWQFENRGTYSTGETAADGNANIVVHANHI